MLFMKKARHYRAFSLQEWCQTGGIMPQRSNYYASAASPPLALRGTVLGSQVMGR